MVTLHGVATRSKGVGSQRFRGLQFRLLPEVRPPCGGKPKMLRFRWGLSPRRRHRAARVRRQLAGDRRRGRLPGGLPSTYGEGGARGAPESAGQRRKLRRYQQAGGRQQPARCPALKTLTSPLWAGCRADPRCCRPSPLLDPPKGHSKRLDATPHPSRHTSELPSCAGMASIFVVPRGRADFGPARNVPGGGPLPKHRSRRTDAECYASVGTFRFRRQHRATLVSCQAVGDRT